MPLTEKPVLRNRQTLSLKASALAVILYQKFQTLSLLYAPSAIIAFLQIPAEHLLFSLVGITVGLN